MRDLVCFIGSGTTMGKSPLFAGDLFSTHEKALFVRQGIGMPKIGYFSQVLDLVCSSKINDKLVNFCSGSRFDDPSERHIRNRLLNLMVMATE